MAFALPRESRAAKGFLGFPGAFNHPVVRDEL